MNETDKTGTRPPSCFTPQQPTIYSLWSPKFFKCFAKVSSYGLKLQKWLLLSFLYTLSLNIYQSISVIQTNGSNVTAQFSTHILTFVLMLILIQSC